MSDGDNEKAFASTEEYDTEERCGEEHEERFTDLQLVHKRVRKSLADLRHPRQKFCARWENDFPWLRADKVSESLGICTICNKQLVCKKSHLERHEKSYKHMRLVGFDSLDTEGDTGDTNFQPEPNETEFLECGKEEPLDDEEFEHAIEMDGDYKVEIELNATKPAKHVVPERKSKNNSKKQQQKEASSNMTLKSPSNQSQKSPNKLDRFKLLKRIDRDRQELNSFFYSKRRRGSPTPPPTPRDSFDLFFESVSASVKTLPPKLAAEVKARVSQIIAEFELRAICEREALESSAAARETNIMVASTTTDGAAAVAHDVNGGVVPHIVYTFQPKVRE